MRSFLAFPAFLALVTAPWLPAFATGEELLRPGLYEVEVVLELPHILRPMAYRTVRRCLDREALMTVESVPGIAACPVVAERAEGDRLGRQWLCATANQGMATASYRVAPESFAARIAVTMGGKNMTLVEVQTGRRIGPCRPAAGGVR